jgi:hypothetical protein
MRGTRHEGAGAQTAPRTPFGVALGVLVILTACSSPEASVQYASSAPLAQPSWPAPADPMALAEQAGLVSEPAEYLTTHNHAHLDLFVDGVQITVPGGLGIKLDSVGIVATTTPDGTGHDYQVSTCPAVCLSPLHTHDGSGLIHSESRSANHPPYLLGQLFTEWGLRLDGSCVGEYCKPAALIHIYVNGKPYEGDPAAMPLASLTEIAIVIGQPPTLIPSNWPFDTPT